jgi:hypothetical protein
VGLLRCVVDRRRHLPAAAALTVAVTAATDAAAGGSMWHVATLGLVAAVVAGIRLRLAGRDRGLLQVVSGVVVAQPAIHAAAKLVPHGWLDHGPADGVGTVDVLATLVQVTIAATIVGAVTFAEHLVGLVSAVFGRTGLSGAAYLPHPVPPQPGVRPAARSARRHGQNRPGVVPRRGPPAGVAAA